MTARFPLVRRALCAVAGSVLAVAVVSCGRSTDAGGDARAVATYFHNTLRCESCLLIEKSSREVLEEEFGDELASGAIRWHKLNMELDENRHFVEEYELGMPTLVLSRLEDGRETAWKNLEGVWDHLLDEKALRSYIRREAVAFLSPDGTPVPGSAGD